MHIQGPTIQTYEGPQGPGTILLKSGIVPEIQGLLRPMTMALVLSHDPQLQHMRKGLFVYSRALEAIALRTDTNGQQIFIFKKSEILIIMRSLNWKGKHFHGNLYAPQLPT